MVDKQEPQETEKIERQNSSSGSGTSGSYPSIICTTSETSGKVTFGKGTLHRK